MRYEDMEPNRAPEYGSVRYTQQFVLSDCKVIECIEGHISIDDGQYSTLYRCPECSRGTVMATAVYRGPVHYRTEEEMKQRFHQRKEINFNKHARYAVATEMVQMLQKMLGRIYAKTEPVEGPF